MPSAGQVIRALDFSTAVHASQATDETGFSDTSYVQGANVCGVAFVAPTSGRVLVLWTARAEVNTTADVLTVSAAIRSGGVIGSGTSFSGATDTDAVHMDGLAAQNSGAGSHRMLSGLTPGATYNAVTEHKITANTGDIFDRSITVIALP